jgi:replication factor C small subunit
MSWNEVYRPKTFDEVVGQEKVVTYYTEGLSNGNIDHAIFTGNSGVGKTTMAKVVANEFDVDILEFNGSDDRTLNFVREKVIPAMRYVPFRGEFRLVFIDECESMLKEAWFCLRSPLEKYEHNAKVIFSCNDDVVPPYIRSRCIAFNFPPISKSEMKKRLQFIAQEEGLQIDDKVFESICEKSKGDLRKAVKLLEGYKNKALAFGDDEFSELFTLM